ncbi:MAG TPA: ATP-binding protein [Thermoanaerobaculia bacterium]|nr:ATP-binding protein [Thermoanaerobaculia bacterium]
MIDLKRVPHELFACALESNLRRLGAVRKLDIHFLDAVKVRLAADCTWLYRGQPGDRVVSGNVLRGESSLCDQRVAAAFLRHELPAIPRTLLLTRMSLHGRQVAVVGVGRRNGAFAAGERRVLERLCAVFVAELQRREHERLARVLDRIRGKIVAELRPRDLAYQILDGLHQLVDYDHSSAFLAYDSAAAVFRIEAEKIVWTKAKSGFVGHEIHVTPERVSALSRSTAIHVLGAPGGADQAFRQVLDYHRGPGVPPAASILSAPLFFGREFLGLLKIALARHQPFDAGDVAVVERFLPSAAVSMRNAQVNRSLERQAMRAELKAGLVTLASAVAHDVNNAVGTILPLAQQMREELRGAEIDRETFDKDLGVIVDNARLCTRIFTNMLRVAGSGRAAEGPVDLNHVVGETLPFFQGQAGRRGVEVVLDLAAGLPAVRASRHDLQHMILNLAQNSLEALGDGGGRVTIATAAAAPGFVSFSVADDGPGIRRDLLDKVQEPFFSTKLGGTGLGLSICRALAWQCGGSLEVSSTPELGPGTRVTITVGVEAAAGLSTLATAAAARPRELQ